MSPEAVMWLIGQTIVLAIIIVGAFVRSTNRVTKLETAVSYSQLNLDARIAELRNQHVSLAEKVDGISRSLARLEGRHENEGSPPLRRTSS